MEYFKDSSDSDVSSPDCENDSHSDSDSSSANEGPKRKKAKVTRGVGRNFERGVTSACLCKSSLWQSRVWPACWP